MGFNEASLLVKVTLVMLGVGLLLDLIGFASDYWSSYDGGFFVIHNGLWGGSGRGPCK